MKLKVMTFNIQHAEAYTDPEHRINFDNTAAPILEEHPDIVGLNEVRDGENPEFPDFVNQTEELRKRSGMKKGIFGQAIYVGHPDCRYGNATLANCEILAHEVIPIPLPDPLCPEYKQCYEARCLLKTEYCPEGKKLTVFSTHFGLNPDERKKAVQIALNAVNETEGPVLLMGDMNTLPEDPILAPLREVLESTAEHFGRPEPTFPSDVPKITIDYIWYRGLKPVSFKVVEATASDHRPLAAEFEF